MTGAYIIPDMATHISSCHFGHHHIGNNKIRNQLARFFEPGESVAGKYDPVFSRKQPADIIAHFRMVFHHEN